MNPLVDILVDIIAQFKAGFWRQQKRCHAPKEGSDEETDDEFKKFSHFSIPFVRLAGVWGGCGWSGMNRPTARPFHQLV